MACSYGPSTWQPYSTPYRMTRPDAPAPNRRRGPRPLLLHLANPDPALVRGIAAYRNHPAHRTWADPPAIWTEGETRLIDFNPAGSPTVLFVPSLVNRSYVLDLVPGRSMMRWLAEAGVRPLLLDWGWPGMAERRYTLTDVIAGPMERALAAAGPAVLAGYCMGGLLTIALALRRPAQVRALALLATPWAFAPGPIARQLPLLEPVMAMTGTLPVDGLQALFAAVEPGSVAAKFRRFSTLDPASAAAHDFVVLEDWLNDGVPLAAPIAREVLGEWYGQNTPGTGQWRVAGQPIRPEDLRLPTWIAAPQRDRIVPPESALPLAELIPGAILHRPGSGHIGMTAGPRAEAALWVPMLTWLRSL